MVHDGTGGVIALARAGHGHAGGRNVAAVLSWIELPAKPAIHGQVKDGLVLTRGVHAVNSFLGLAGEIGRPAVAAVVMVRAREAVGW